MQTDETLGNAVTEITDASGEKFSVLSILGRGGCGVVYRVKQAAFGREVALKLITDPDPAHCQRLLREARATAKLAHKNIIKIFSVGTSKVEQKPFLVLEYFPSQSLAARLEAGGTLDDNTFVRIFDQILVGLEFAHKQGFIHRDLKPSNILVSDNLQVKIADFGIAKAIDQDNRKSNSKPADTATAQLPPTEQAITPSGEVIGSPLYMSPEQCGGEQIDQRSDIYSVGCMMVTALTGAPPFDGDSSLEIMYKHINEEPPKLPRMLRPSFQKVIAKALSKEPINRYSSAASMQRDLHDEGDTQSLVAEISTIAGNMVPRSSRAERLRSILLPIATAMILLLATGLTILQYVSLKTAAPGKVDLLQKKTVNRRLDEIHKLMYPRKSENISKREQLDRYAQCDRMCADALNDATQESIAKRDDNSLIKLHLTWAECTLGMDHHMAALEHVKKALALAPSGLTKAEYVSLLDFSLEYYSRQLKSKQIFIYSRQLFPNEGEDKAFLADIRAGTINVLHRQALLHMDSKRYEMVIEAARKAFKTAMVNDIPGNADLTDTMLLQAVAQIALGRTTAALDTLDVCSKQIWHFLPENIKPTRGFQIWHLKMTAAQILNDAEMEAQAYRTCETAGGCRLIPGTWLPLVEMDHATMLYNHNRQKEAFALFDTALARLHTESVLEAYNYSHEELTKAEKDFENSNRSQATQELATAYKFIQVDIGHKGLIVPGCEPAEWHKLH